TLHLAPPATARLQTTALGVGVIAVLGAAVLGFFGDGQFFQSYLMAFLFWLGLSLGALVLLFTQHLAGGPWGPMIARPLESAATLVPLMALLFVPVLIGARELYVWTDPAYVAGHPTVAAKSEYLNMTWFVIRAVVYFVVWTAAALVYRRTSLRQDEEQGKAAGTLAQRRRHVVRLLRPHDDVRRDRLGDVADARVVLRHLPGDHHGEPGDHRDRVRDPRDHVAGGAQPVDRRPADTAAPAGPRQLPAG